MKKFLKSYIVAIVIALAVGCLGWFVENTKTIAYADGGETEYTIDYETNGGNVIPQGSYIAGTGIASLPTPTKAGFVFIGWTETNESTDINYVTAIAGTETGNKTFYAKWEDLMASLQIDDGEIVYYSNFGKLFDDANAASGTANIVLFADIIADSTGNFGTNLSANMDNSDLPYSSLGGLSVEKGRTFVIDLKGHKIDKNLSAGIGQGCVFSVEANASLTLDSSDGLGKITGGYNSENSRSAGGIHVLGGTLVVRNCEITENKAVNYGSAIYAFAKGGSTSISLDNCKIYNNYAALVSSGHSCIFFDGALTIDGNTQIYNNYTGTGDARYVENISFVDLPSDCRIGVGDLTDGAIIGVTPTMTEQVLTSGNNFSGLTYFRTDTPNFDLVINASGEIESQTATYAVTYSHFTATPESVSPATDYPNGGELYTVDTTYPLIKEGYTQIGWSKDAENGEKVTSFVVVGSVSLFPVWQEKTAISINETPNASVEYSKQNVAYEITGTNADLDFVIQYYVGDSWTTTAPVTVGDYNVKITRAEDDTFKAFSTEITNGVSITKKTLSVIGVTPIPREYDGTTTIYISLAEADRGHLSGIEDGDTVYIQTYPSSGYVDSPNAGTNLQIHFYSSFPLAGYDAANYFAPIPDVRVDIYQVDNSWTTTPNITGWIVGQTSNDPVGQAKYPKYGNPIFEYKLQGAEDNSYSTTKPSEGGNYTMRARVTETANWKELVSAEVNFTIEQLEFVWKNYDGTELRTDDIMYGGDAYYGSVPTRAREGYSYTFDKWVTTQGGTIEATLSNITENTMVYASYTESANNNSIIHNLSHLTSNPNTTTTGMILSGNEYTVTLIADENYDLPTIITVVVGEKTLSVGTDYSYDSDTGILVIGAEKVVGNIVITATALQNNYTITYDTNGGNTITQGSYTVGTGLASLPIPTKTNCVFLGWVETNIVTDTNYITSISSTDTGTKVFYAIWSETNPTRTIVEGSLLFKTQSELLLFKHGENDWQAYTGAFTITGSSINNTSAYNYVVVESGAHNITLSGVHIGAGHRDTDPDSPSGDQNISNDVAENPFNIDGTANVTLMLVGENKLLSANRFKSGLRVAENAFLTISGTGSLEVSSCKAAANKNSSMSAGIGGNSDDNKAGTITIFEAKVSAYSTNGAGIGGGANNSVYNSVKSLTINSGTVTMTTSNTDEIATYADEIFINGGVVRSGASHYYARFNVVPKNSAGQNVYCATFELPGRDADGFVEVNVSSLVFKYDNNNDDYVVNIVDHNYEMNGARSVSRGLVHVYMPVGDAATEYDGKYYCVKIKQNNQEKFVLNNVTFRFYSNMGSIDRTDPINVPYGTVGIADNNKITYNGVIVTATPVETEESYPYYFRFMSWGAHDIPVCGPKLIMVNFETIAKTYTITFDSNGGEGVEQKNYTVETPNFSLDPTSKQGFNFVGWFGKKEIDGTIYYIGVSYFESGNIAEYAYTDLNNENLTAANSLTTINCEELAQNITVIAKWTARTDIPYKAKHWQESLDQTSEASETRVRVEGVYYDLSDTDDLTGTTNTNTNAVAKIYTGFETQTYSQTNINENGASVVNIYYKRLTYKLTLTTPTWAFFQNHTKYGTIPTWNDTPTKTDKYYQDYVFTGWSDGTNFYAESTTLPIVTADVTYTAVFSHGDPYPYYHIFDLNGATIVSGQSDYVLDVDTGFYKKYFDIDNRDIPDGADDESYILRIPDVNRPGYTLNGWFIKHNDKYLGIIKNTESYPIVEVENLSDEKLNVDSSCENSILSAYFDVYVIAKWTVNTDTEYKAKHWQESLDQTSEASETRVYIGEVYYELSEISVMTGTTDTETNAIARTYTGFEAQSFTQTTINGDGSSVINIYYSRNTYTITIEVNNTNYGSVDVSTVENVRYGSLIEQSNNTSIIIAGTTITATPIAPTSECEYRFIRWDPKIVVVTGSMTYTAVFMRMVFEVETPEIDNEDPIDEDRVDADIEISDGIEENTEFIVRTKKSETIDKKIVAPAKQEIIKAYNAQFLKNNVEYVGYTGKMIIRIATPVEMKGRENIQIVIIDKTTGAAVTKTATIEGDYLKFETDSLGDFAITADKKQNHNLTWLWILLGIMGFGLIVIIVFVLKRKIVFVVNGEIKARSKYRFNQTITTPTSLAGFIWFEDEQLTKPFTQEKMKWFSKTIYGKVNISVSKKEKEIFVERIIKTEGEKSIKVQIGSLSKKYLEKLNKLTDQQKSDYCEIKNELFKYDKLTNSITQDGDTFKFKNNTRVKISILRGELKFFVDMEKRSIDGRFKRFEESKFKKYTTVPLEFTIDRQVEVRKAKNTINRLAKSLQLEKDEKTTKKSFERLTLQE